MIPFGSVGGCHSRVAEEAVTFMKVTFCGGSDGSECQGTNLDMRITLGEKKFFVLFFFVKVLCVTCIYCGETNMNDHSSVSQSGPAGHRGVVATLRVHINYD